MYGKCLEIMDRSDRHHRNIHQTTTILLLYRYPETNSSPLKIGAPGSLEIPDLETIIFRGENVSFREGTLSLFGTIAKCPSCICQGGNDWGLLIADTLGVIRECEGAAPLKPWVSSPLAPNKETRWFFYIWYRDIDINCWGDVPSYNDTDFWGVIFITITLPSRKLTAGGPQNDGPWKR